MNFDSQEAAIQAQRTREHLEREMTQVQLDLENTKKDSIFGKRTDKQTIHIYEQRAELSEVDFEALPNAASNSEAQRNELVDRLRGMGHQMSEIQLQSNRLYDHATSAVERNQHMAIVELAAPSALQPELLSEMKKRRHGTYELRRAAPQAC